MSKGTITFKFDVHYRRLPTYAYIVGSSISLGYRVDNGRIFITENTSLYDQVRGIKAAMEETKITILSTTESIAGQNLSHVFFSANDREWSRRPLLTKMVKGHRCTLIQKYNDLSAVGVDVNNLETYGLLRYFLWFLITGEWYINILRQANTRRFLKALKGSEYSIWIKTFTIGELKGYDKYFVE